MSKLPIVILVAVFSGIAFFIYYYFIGLDNNNIPKLQPNNLNNTSPSTTGEIKRYQDYKVEEVATNLKVPWSIVFTDNNRILVSERNGNIRVIQDGTLLQNPLIKLDVETSSEEGLLGIEKHYNYNQNKYLYACFTYLENNILYDKVVRLKDNNDIANIDKEIINKIPAAKFHAGCRLKFGPDNKLYITTGDALDRNKAQDINSLAGKILRLNDGGTIPNDNPYQNNPVWSFGHRNVQGIAWDENNVMYASEHGPSGMDGPRGGDEINKIEKGKNYGWPVISYNKKQTGLINPLVLYNAAVAPASALIYKADNFPQFTNKLIFGGLVGTDLYVVDLNTLKTNKLDLNLGRIRDVVEAPNGDIYFSTSNTDGRGKPNSGDDKIYRITIK